MEGCSAPLVVRFADTQKEKEQKKLQQMQVNLWGISTGTTNGLPSLTPATAVVPTPLPTPTPAAIASPQILATASPAQQTNPYFTTDAVTTPSLQLFHQLQSIGLPQTFIQGEFCIITKYLFYVLFFYLFVIILLNHVLRSLFTFSYFLSYQILYISI